MAKKTDSVVEEENKDEPTEEVETEKSEDESSKGEASSSEDTNTEETEDEAIFEKRFTQFGGDDLVDYAKNLEEGYANTSAEGLRLNQRVKELEAQVGAADASKELPAQPDASNNPALAWANSEMERRNREGYEAFVREHPEILNDPALAERLNKRLGAVAKAAYSDEGEFIDMKEGLDIAYASIVGSSSNSQEDISTAAKAQAAGSKTTSKTKSAPTTGVTDAEIGGYRKLQGLKVSDKSDNEIAEILAKHKK